MLVIASLFLTFFLRPNFVFVLSALRCLRCGMGDWVSFAYAQAGERLSACSWMEVAGGDMRLSEEGRAQGASEFGTAKVSGVALRKKKWYFEVLSLIHI